jgi:hypothetical protein
LYQVDVFVIGMMAEYIQYGTNQQTMVVTNIILTLNPFYVLLNNHGKIFIASSLDIPIAHTTKDGARNVKQNSEHYINIPLLTGSHIILN